MVTLENLAKFKEYLYIIESRLLKKYFEAQKEYIHCKEGCADCCKHGEYPTSEVELVYLMSAYHALDNETKKQIIANIDEIKANREANNGMYKCPFLIDNKCSVYNNRTIICRTHGLLFYIKDKDGNSRNKMPACVNKGLNYSEVYDIEQKIISPEMWEKSGIKAEPKAYNISREALLDNDIVRDMGVEFGESRALIDWF